MRLSPNASRITAVTFLISLGVVDVVSAQQAATSTLITNVSVLAFLILAAFAVVVGAFTAKRRAGEACECTHHWGSNRGRRGTNALCH